MLNVSVGGTPVFNKLSMIFAMSSVAKRTTASHHGSSKEVFSNSRNSTRTSAFASPGSNSVFHQRRSVADHTVHFRDG